jgi:DNA-binding response OmpR family regulator
MFRVYRILLIEDESVTAEIVMQYLNRYNFSVAHIEDGREAPVRLRGNSYDLIILDLMMPNVDGFTILESMRRTSDLKIPVLIASARTDKEAVLRVKELKAAGYLTKPVSEQQMIEKIALALGIPAAEIIDKRQHPFTSRIWQDQDAALQIELSGIPNNTTAAQVLSSISAGVKMLTGVRSLSVQIPEHFLIFPQHFKLVMQIVQHAQGALKFARLNTRVSGEYLKHLGLVETETLRGLARFPSG